MCVCVCVCVYTHKHVYTHTYKNHSTAKRRAMVVEGMLRAARMMTRVTMLELGTDGRAMAPTAVRNLHTLKNLNYKLHVDIFVCILLLVSAGILERLMWS